MEKQISSSQNKVFKSLLSLRDNKTRKKGNEFFVEGLREIKQALENGFELKQIALCDDFLTEEESQLLRQSDFSKKLLWSFTPSLFEKLLVRKSSSGLFFVFSKKEPLDFVSSKEGLYLILDGLEKPSNLGAIFRTASAAGVSQVFLTNSKVDVYHPHVIRNSLGACFSTPCSIFEESKLLDILTKNQIPVFASYLNKVSKPYTESSYHKPCAFLLGSESHGISDFWKKSPSQKIIIPMAGPMDSLNVSVATSILLFEAKRQRS